MARHIPIIIEKCIDVDTDNWQPHIKMMATINKNTSSRGFEQLSGGAVNIRRSLIFEIRHNKLIQEISYDTQVYRIKYQEQNFDIIDYDDYMENNHFVKLTGAYYG